MEKMISAIIISLIIASNTMPTQGQLHTLYQASYWDGSALQIGSKTAEVKDDSLFIDGEKVSTFYDLNSKVEILKEINSKEPESTKYVASVIATYINSTGAEFAPHVWQGLYRNGYWDGSRIGTSTKWAEVREGELYTKGYHSEKEIVWITPMDTAYDIEALSLDDIGKILYAKTKKGNGIWFADFERNEIVFDSKGVRKIIIKVPEAVGKWQVSLPRNSKKYFYIHSGTLSKDVARVTIKTGKVKWY